MSQQAWSLGPDCQTQYIDEYDGNCATLDLQCHSLVLNTLACNLFELQTKDILMLYV